MARPSLKGNVTRPKGGQAAAAEAAELARFLTDVASGAPGGDYEGEMETVSYHLPVELIELYRDLAEERLRIERAEKRRARRAGEKPPQARRSASAIVREAMEAHRPKVEEELRRLRGKGGGLPG